MLQSCIADIGTAALFLCPHRNRAGSWCEMVRCTMRFMRHQQQEGCNSNVPLLRRASWWWCDERDGCTDEDGRRLPHKGCELRREAVVRRLGQPPPHWHLPTFAAGFMKRELNTCLHLFYAAQITRVHNLGVPGGNYLQWSMSRHRNADG